MRTMLINMPWSSIEVPSLAVGILSAVVHQHRPQDEVIPLDANLELVDWICERMPFTLREYELFALDTYFSGCGDWIFTGALYRDIPWRLPEFTERIGNTLDPADRELAIRLHRLMPQFIDELAVRVVSERPDVLGFTSTFQQNIAALALARRVKQLAPEILTVFGGANCDGDQGAALHRNFDCVDLVVRGEGDRVFPQLLDQVEAGHGFARLPGVCWRFDQPGSVANPMNARPLAPGQIGKPEFATYFERLARSRASEWVEPKLVVEGARGCWWGQKHHCTFCGLNGSSMEFRSKSGESFFDELKALAVEHRVLDFYVVDNIIDMSYLRSVLPRIVEEGLDYRFHYEIKSNMRLDQLQLLRQAGLVHVQPGIESLSSKVLDIMDKGVTGCLNVRLLRDAATVGIAMYWNYLYGFPGESVVNYEQILAQLPSLYHLMPPTGASRIALERFSPYYDRPELGFAGERRAADHYYVNYDLADAELLDLAYVFETEARGIDAALADRLLAALDRWQAYADQCSLVYLDHGEQIELFDNRPDFHWQHLVIGEPVEVALFRLLAQPHTVPGLLRKLHLADDEPSAVLVHDAMARWLALGITFTDNGYHVLVAPAESNQRIFEVTPSLPAAGLAVPVTA
ncbi:MAG: RiPP maturation radical SAM C-methyltransferase [Actinomycetota bacterium]|nr:RiPP maturation radical SAM C-methyltransferase [Actinomycetota bacterium]MDQ2957960.1 RiPP maturation radical SAM C-methyltransferase [Actinomycetota bacterium]